MFMKIAPNEYINVDKIVRLHITGGKEERQITAELEDKTNIYLSPDVPDSRLDEYLSAWVSSANDIAAGKNVDVDGVVKDLSDLRENARWASGYIYGKWTQAHSSDRDTLQGIWVAVACMVVDDLDNECTPYELRRVTI